MRRITVWAVCCAAMLAGAVRGADASSDFDVDVTLTNNLERDVTDLPVLLQVFRVFGRGVDYTAFNPKGFHVIGADGVELPLSLKPVPPDFSLANDEIVITLAKFRQGEALALRIVNTHQDNPKQAAYDGARLLANPNNLIPNGGFERGAEGWQGGTVVGDTIHAGAHALLLETAGGGGHAKLQCAAPVSFVKDRNYYFGVWAKCENVTRRTWRYHMPWSLQPISARLTFSGNPLVFPEYDSNPEKNHLVRLMDNRDWYCYEANALSTLCTPQPALNTCTSTLSLALDQENMPYLDANKPARVWLDDVMLFEQPRVEVSWARIQKKLAPDGFFLYRRAPTCLSPGAFGIPWQDNPDPFMKVKLPPLDPPRPYEKIEKINETAAQGERKTITLGINTAKPIQGLCLEGGDLKGPGGASLGEAAREIEFYYTPAVNYNADGNGLEGWALDGNAPRDPDRPGFADYLVAYRIPANAAPGTYKGTIKVKGDGKDLGEVPVALEIANFPLKVITEQLVGSIDNGTCSPEKPGVVTPGKRDAAFYKFYARCNFSYMMMFRRFVPFKGETDEVDIPALVSQVRQIRDVAGCNAGVGLYWDCSLDKQGNKNGPDGGHGLWTRCGRKADAYRARVKEMDSALAQAGLPPLVYMIWDEARFCDPAKFGILKGTGALTTSDINFREACESLRLGLFTHLSVDAPGCDYGPMFREYATKCGAKIGWDTMYGPLCNRYQTSLMLPHGGSLISQWHLGYHLVYHSKFQVLARSQPVIGAGEGMIDFRYFETLKDLIAQAKKANRAKKEVEAAEKFLKEILAFCSDDYHCMSNTEIFTYNGGPERWGDDWFYDRWRTELRRHILAILGQNGSARAR